MVEDESTRKIRDLKEWLQKTKLELYFEQLKQTGIDNFTIASLKLFYEEVLRGDWDDGYDSWPDGWGNHYMTKRERKN